MAINFFAEQIKFELAEKRIVKKWITYVIELENRKRGTINYIFSSDNYVLEINKNYLKHDYCTDIITFNYNEGEILNSDIFISIDTIMTNAIEFSNTFYEELHRVIIHGILHLIGYNDSDEDSLKIMRNKEDEYLSLLYSKFLIN